MFVDEYCRWMENACVFLVNIGVLLVNVDLGWRMLVLVNVGV